MNEHSDQTEPGERRLAVLGARVRDAVLGRLDPLEVERTLRTELAERISVGEVGESVPLMVLLGEFLLATDRDAEAEAVFGQALSYDAWYVPAMIGVADCSILRERFPAAQETLKSALALTRDRQDLSLQVLDRLGACAALQSDTRTLALVFDEMCQSAEALRTLDRIPTLALDVLLESGQGSEGLALARCLVRKAAAVGTMGAKQVLLRYASAVLEQSGWEDADVAEALAGIGVVGPGACRPRHGP